MIYSIGTSVVGRVDVNHFDFAHIRFLQKFEHFEVVALNVKVLSGVPIDAVLGHGTECLADRTCGFAASRGFTGPCELVKFLAGIGGVTEKLTQHVEVYNPTHLAVGIRHFGKARRHNTIQLIKIYLRSVGAL